MKKLFNAIRNGDISEVKDILQKDPKSVNSIAKQPPKKDDGQSPLQVAFKTGNFDIADLLMDYGANVNYREKESVNEWKAPVVHDAIRATIFSTRYPVSYGNGNDKAKFERAFSSLKKMVKLGAKLDSEDSYGNSVGMRAVLDARQLDLESKNKNLYEDLKKVFTFLKANKVDFHKSTKKSESPIEFCRGEPVYFFIK